MYETDFRNIITDLSIIIIVNVIPSCLGFAIIEPDKYVIKFPTPLP